MMMFTSVLASNQGGRGGFSLHFRVVVNFYPPKLFVFSRPYLMKPWMLRARKVSSFMSLSLSRLTVERDRTFPIAPMKKGATCQLHPVNQFTAIF
jgi:hypothetical protein